jgi:hypothetical protein
MPSATGRRAAASLSACEPQASRWIAPILVQELPFVSPNTNGRQRSRAPRCGIRLRFFAAHEETAFGTRKARTRNARAVRPAQWSGRRFPIGGASGVPFWPESSVTANSPTLPRAGWTGAPAAFLSHARRMELEAAIRLRKRACSSYTTEGHAAGISGVGRGVRQPPVSWPFSCRWGPRWDRLP